MTATLWLPRGLPASGKTTWSRDMLDRQPVGSIVRLNRDDIRAMMLPADYRTPKPDGEKVVSAVEHGPIAGLLSADVDVIVDDTNLRVKFVRNLMQIAAKVGANSEVVDEFLEVPVKECVVRDSLRDRPVGEGVIQGMHDKFLSGGRTLHVPVLDNAPVAGKPYTPVPGTPRAIVVDIDGTVALHGERSPYDTSRYHEDAPNTAVIEQVRIAAAAGYRILFTSGRSREFELATERWLVEHVTTDGMLWDLIMRPAGDVRNDAIVKLELFDEHIRDRFDVRWVLDDRDRVVEAWRSIGLPVMQVAEGNF